MLAQQIKAIRSERERAAVHCYFILYGKTKRKETSDSARRAQARERLRHLAKMYPEKVERFIALDPALDKEQSKIIDELALIVNKNQVAYA